MSDTRTIFEKGAPGRRAFVAPELDVPLADRERLLPAGLRRSEPARLPEVSEPEIVRHYVNVSKRNFDLDSGFYPLGSCTMKHNPRLHERVAGLAGHARLHPLQHPRRAQGALELMWNLEGVVGAPMKRELGIKTLDLAKRLLDYGYHPPTVYFPLLVDEALLIEPTETETRETLDAFAGAVRQILAEAKDDPEIARNAPYSTPVRRLDEAGAAKRPIIRQPTTTPQYA
jgi:glycine cleavage system protein P-like pyridoxal-binding family